jgi:predicted DNA-binding protein
MSKKDIKVTFMLTPRLFDRLEDYAKSIEKTKSEVLRDLIEDYIPEQSKPSSQRKSASPDE